MLASLRRKLCAFLKELGRSKCADMHRWAFGWDLEALQGMGHCRAGQCEKSALELHTPLLFPSGRTVRTAVITFLSLNGNK